MSNVIIAGTATGATALPVASTIDAVNDYIPIYTASATATQAINRNTYLGIASTPLGLTDTQSPTNKTFNNTNSLTIKDGSLTIQNTSDTTKQANFSLSGNTTGTIRTYTLPNYNATLASLAGTEIFTNKTLTSPTINSPTITNAILSADAITGFSVSNTGTLYGISVTTGTIGTAAIANNAITSALIATNAVAASNLATSAITIGYTQITGNITTTSATPAQATGLTATVTIPSGGRKIKITAYASAIANSAAASNNTFSIWDGTVNVGTQLNSSLTSDFSANGSVYAICFAIVTPSAGSKTYNIGWSVSSGTGTITASATQPAFILVEAI